MSNKFKSGLLIFMLVGPLLFFGLFHLFGTNHYDIKKYHPLEVTENGDTLYHKISDFEVINQDGKKVSLNSLKGKLFVANFFSTDCPTICPRVNDQLLYLQKSFKNHQDEVAFISYTIDNINDNTTALYNYAQETGINTNVRNLVNTNDVITRKLINEIYKLPMQNGNVLTHSKTLVLVDKDLIIRGYYDGTKEKEVENLLSEIWILMYQQNE